MNTDNLGWYQDLQKQGYVAFKRATPRIKLKHLLTVLHTDKIVIKKLTPKNILQAKPNTLSSKFGCSEFPIHTDYSLEKLPPKYLILYTPFYRKTKTYI